MLPFVSNLPQASTLPLGMRLMCSGTISQETGASHLPVAASGGSGSIRTDDDVPVAAPLVKLSVWSPVPAMPRSTNVALPEVPVVAVRVPCSVPVPLAMLALT